MSLLDFTPSPTVLYVGTMDRDNEIIEVHLLLGWSEVGRSYLPVIQKWFSRHGGFDTEMVAVSASEGWVVSADPGYWETIYREQGWSIQYRLGVVAEDVESVPIEDEGPIDLGVLPKLMQKAMEAGQRAAAAERRANPLRKLSGEDFDDFPPGLTDVQRQAELDRKLCEEAKTSKFAQGQPVCDNCGGTHEPFHSRPSIGDDE